MERITLGAQSHYAELLQLVVDEEAMPRVVGQRGSFVSKSIRGKRYWYFQSSQLGKQKQAYVGPDTAEVCDFMERAGEQWAGEKERRRQRQKVSAMAQSGGAMVLSAAERDVLDVCARAGVFRLGGVVVGSAGFATIGNMLGVRFPPGILRTVDVDIANDPKLAIALAPDVDAYDPLDERFVPVAPIGHDGPSTSFRVRGQSLRLDLLTPLVGRARAKPVRLPKLGFAALPLRFLDYLIEDAQPAAIVGGAGTLVNVPLPARFLLHKLLIAGERPRHQHTKANKDVAQAAALAEVLLSDSPGDVMLAWEALDARGKGWVSRVRTGIARLDGPLRDALQGTLA